MDLGQWKPSNRSRIIGRGFLPCRCHSLTMTSGTSPGVNDYSTSSYMLYSQTCRNCFHLSFFTFCSLEANLEILTASCSAGLFLLTWEQSTRTLRHKTHTHTAVVYTICRPNRTRYIYIYIQFVRNNNILNIPDLIFAHGCYCSN